ncbi:unnamed protein product [Mycena citricolor]|uniref:Osmotin thaumatin-like protein n=1 Tax=Mycena citricolor TaxID=2018698 RepID=A0AAD2GZJ5_9AGAR|nr:unnamed protein product [Mycena citricolor]
MLSATLQSLLFVLAVSSGIAHAEAKEVRRLELSARQGSHPFTFVNRCGGPITPVIADTKCGYSPRCGDAASYSGPQPGAIAPGASATYNINTAWVGRVFASHPQCGPKGESCTLGEFNLDTGSQFTAQAYDISNIQGFTDGMAISAAGCAGVSCPNVNCGCTQAYAPGDLSGCGADLPVRACGPGSVAFTVTWCP